MKEKNERSLMCFPPWSGKTQRYARSGKTLRFMEIYRITSTLSLLNDLPFEVLDLWQDIGAYRPFALCWYAFGLRCLINDPC